jgi:hypothetical protein
MDGMPDGSIEIAAAVAMPRLFTRGEVVSACVLAVVSALCSAGLVAAAIVLHPPAAIVPVLVIVCVGSPVFGTWELPLAITALRAKRAGHRHALAMLRRTLDELPETDHPLGR